MAGKDKTPAKKTVMQPKTPKPSTKKDKLQAVQFDEDFISEDGLSKVHQGLRKGGKRYYYNEDDEEQSGNSKSGTRGRSQKRQAEIDSNPKAPKSKPIQEETTPEKDTSPTKTPLPDQSPSTSQQPYFSSEQFKAYLDREKESSHIEDNRNAQEKQDDEDVIPGNLIGTTEWLSDKEKIGRELMAQVNRMLTDNGYPCSF